MVVPPIDVRWQRPETLLAILDQISDAVLVFDKDIRLIGVNSSAERLFELPANRLLGKLCWDLFALSTPASNSPAQDLELSTRDSWCLPTGHVRLRLENGRERTVVIRTIELHDASGAIESVVATASEITDPLSQTVVPPVPTNGAHQVTESPLTESPKAARRPKKYHPIVIRNRRLAAVLGTLILMLTAGVASIRVFSPGPKLSPEQQRQAAAEQEKREAAARFKELNPAQHFEHATWGLRKGAPAAAVAESLEHLKAIPASAPEASRSKALEIDLRKASNLATAHELISAISDGDLPSGMDKLQHADTILQSVTRQYPKDADAERLLRDAEAGAQQLASRFPQEFAVAETKLVNFSWEKGGFGTVMIANFTIRNDSPIDLGDFKIRCTHFDPSGIVTDQNAGTAFGVVKSHATARIANVNMGFLNSTTGNPKSSKTDCEISGLKLAAQSQAFTSSR